MAPSSLFLLRGCPSAVQMDGPSRHRHCSSLPLSRRHAVSCCVMPPLQPTQVVQPKDIPEKPGPKELPSLASTVVSPPKEKPQSLSSTIGPQPETLSSHEPEEKLSLPAFTSKRFPCAPIDFSREEFRHSCKERGENARRYSILLSKLVGDVDIASRLSSFRDLTREGYNEFCGLPIEDYNIDLPAFVKEQACKDAIRVREAIMKDFEGAKAIPGLPLYFIDAQGTLHVPEGTFFALDTSLLVYLGQAGVKEVEEKWAAVLSLLESPFQFVMAEMVNTELHAVMMTSKVRIEGIITRQSIIHNKLLASFLEMVLGWAFVLSKADQRKNRATRLKKLEYLLGLLSSTHFVQSEEGEAAKFNLFRLICSYLIQPYDAKILIDSTGSNCQILLAEDMQHGQKFDCVRDGVMRKTMVWNPLRHNISFY